MKHPGAGAAIVLASVLMQTVGAQSGNDLMRLTVPADQLPPGCQLAPIAGGPVPTNPAIVTDARFLGMMHASIFLPFPEDPTGARDQLTADRSRAVMEAAPGRAARVEAGYAASYREEGGFHEIGVFALRLKEPSAEAPIPNTPRSTTITKGSVVIFSWIDGQRASPDRGCLDVIRRHVASVDLK